MNQVEIIYLGIEQKSEYEELARQIIEKCFEEEKLDKSNLYVSITLTDNEHIREINREHRTIDKETDVLSFPMFKAEEIHVGVDVLGDPMIGEDILGDIIISIPKVEEQSKEYGNGFKREFCYMLVHGFYHLMGCDHMIEEEKAIMREKEENILKKI